MKKLFFTVAVILGLIGAAALAQTVIPQVTNVGTTDLFQDIVQANPAAGNRYATAAQIAGVPGYVNGGVATTGWTYTFGNAVTDYFIQPAATLATGTLTTAANPGDGQRECFLSTQTQTALTWTANTGQTIGTSASAGVANTPQCETYQASTATWNRSP